MPSGYGAYAGTPRSSGFGLINTPVSRVSGLFSEDAIYRSPRRNNNAPIANTSIVAAPPTPAETAENNSASAPAASDVQSKLVTEVMEQWVPSFREFSRVLSETSEELAKSRLQNAELSKLLSETRARLDEVLADQRRQTQAPPPPPPPPVAVMAPPPSGPSLEDWRAMQESLREVTATLKDFRKWLPTAVPHPAQLPAFVSPNAAAAAMLLENQQKAQMAFSQLFNLQQGTAAPPHQPPPFFVVPPLNQPPPPLQPTASASSTGAVDFRLVPPPTEPTKTSLGGSIAAPVKPPTQPMKTSLGNFTVTLVKPPTELTKTSLGNSNVTLVKPPAVSKTSSSATTASKQVDSSAKPSVFGFKPPQTAAATDSSSPSSLFSFSKLGGGGGTPNTATPSTLLGNLSFGQKPTTVASTPVAVEESKKTTTTTTTEKGGAVATSPATKEEESKKSTDDSVGDESPEAFEPKVDFTPLVEKLPELVETTTGEEGETVLFCERARLFRWDKVPGDTTAAGEWKTRGTGELKILADEAANKFRIVMRRDQIMKLCANHYILPGINMKRHPQKAVACMWNARDFAVMEVDKPNPDGTDEVFMVTFKTEEITDRFEKTAQECLDKVTKRSPQKQTPSGGQEKIETKGKEEPSLFDKFRPKPGSWTCSSCALSVPPEAEKCLACQTVNPNFKGTPSTTTTTTTSGQVATSSTFKFFSTTTSTTTAPSFAFGKTPTSAGASTEPPKFVFGSGATTTTAPSVFPKFGASTTASTPSSSESKPPATGAFANLDLTKSLDKSSGGGFTFNLKATTPSKTDQGEDEESDDEEVAPADLSQVSFKPIIDHLPEKVEVRTGEEEEEVLFEARAKLFRFDTGDWKERGLGQIKILKSPVTGRVRVVMRREQVHKVCCNHPITPGMTLKAFEGPTNSAVKPWVWWAMDFADEDAGSEGKKEMFLVKFKTPEIAQHFHDVFVKAAEAEPALSKEDLELKEGEVEIIENPLPKEKVERARALLLPDDFYAYEDKPLGYTSRTSVSDNLTAAEEAAEDALLAAAVSRGLKAKPPTTATSTSSTSVASSIDVIKSTESLVVVGGPTSPPTPQALPLLSNKPGSWNCNNCFLQVEAETTVCPACESPKPGASQTAQPSLFSGTSFKALGGFEALSKEAGANTLSWLSKPAGGGGGGSNTTPSWSQAGSTLFASTVGKNKTGEGSDGEGEEGEIEADPDPQFEPIIPLPSLVEVKTGEEEEVCLFLRRCKLYRLVDKQWKERGIGEMKILVRPRGSVSADLFNPRLELPADCREVEESGGASYARLLMRREQVLKLCANHALSVDLPEFRPLPVANYGLLWVANDFSEDPAGEVMTLGLKFKNEQDLAHFKASVERARGMLKKD